MDENGDDNKMPKSLRREFIYEPDIISEQLVCLQRFLHEKHQTIEKYVNSIAEGLFWLERKAIRAVNWLENDAPSLVLPTAQVGLAGSFTYFANRGGTPLIRLGSTATMGLMTGFAVYPSWRRLLKNELDLQVVQRFQPLQKAVNFAERLYWRNVYNVVDGWNTYDRACLSISKYLSEQRRRIAFFFKPSRRS